MGAELAFSPTQLVATNISKSRRGKKKKEKQKAQRGGNIDDSDWRLQSTRGL